MRAGIVEKASQYNYSTASNYVNDVGLLCIEKADILIVHALNFNDFSKYNEY